MNADLAVTNVSYRVVANVSFTLSPGEVVGLQGHSGTGKTTLARIVAGHVIPTTGEVASGNKKIPGRGYCPVQLIQQHPERQLTRAGACGGWSTELIRRCWIGSVFDRNGSRAGRWRFQVGSCSALISRVRLIVGHDSSLLMRSLRRSMASAQLNCGGRSSRWRGNATWGCW